MVGLKLVIEKINKMVGKSQKDIEVEEWVDVYIKEHKEPPSYEMISVQFNIKKTAAWHRCKKFRSKMRAQKNSNVIDLKRIGITELRASFEKEFTNRNMSVKELQGAEKVWKWIAKIK